MGGGGGRNPVAGSSDFRLCPKHKHKTHLLPHYRGVGQEYWHMNKMPRHKQYKNLGGSRNADLSALQGVTHQVQGRRIMTRCEIVELL